MNISQEQDSSVEIIQVTSSGKTWERAKTLKIPLWLRLALFTSGIMGLVIGFFAWVLEKLFVLFDVLTCCWIRPLHRFCHKYRRRVRWMFVLSLAALFSGPHPKIAMAFVMSYCYIYSHDAPEKWIQWIIKLSQGRSVARVKS